MGEAVRYGGKRLNAVSQADDDITRWIDDGREDSPKGSPIYEPFKVTLDDNSVAGDSKYIPYFTHGNHGESI